MSPVLSRLLLVYGLVALTAGAFWPSAASLHALWTDVESTTSTHGYLVLAVCLWLVYRNRHRLVAEPARPVIPAYLALLLCALAWLIVWRAGLQILHLALLPVLVGCAWLAAFGWRVTRVLLFPLGYFAFALPFWSYLIGPLQALTTMATGVLVRVAGLPAYIEGNIVMIPAGAFEIAGGCSGMHFFVVGLAIAALLGEIGHDPWRRRLLLAALMGGLCLATNWVRVFTIIVAGHLTDMQHYLVQEDHYWFGWALFGGTVMLFVWICERLPAVAPSREEGAPDMQSGRLRLGPVAASAAALIAVPVAGYAWYSEPSTSSLSASSILPAGREGWSGPLPVPETSWRPVFIGADGSQHALYEGAGEQPIEAFAVVYHFQRDGAELVGYGNSVLGEGSLVAEQEQLVHAGGRPYRETEAVDARGARSLIWWSYDIGGRAFVNPLLSKIWYGVRSLSGTSPRSSLVALRVACLSSCATARQKLHAFVEDMGRDLYEGLAGSSEGG